MLFTYVVFNCQNSGERSGLLYLIYIGEADLDGDGDQREIRSERG